MRGDGLPLEPLVSIAAFLIAGCGDAGGIEGWAGSIDTLPSGVVVVSNPATPLWSHSEQWRIDEILRLGELDGTGPAVFGRIGQIEVDSEGRLYIFDAQANELRVFDGEGQYVRTIGRSGAGPGEFQNVIGMKFAPDEDLWLVDATNARYTVLRGDETLDSFRRPVVMYQLPWLGGFDESGVFHDQATESVDGTTVDVLLRIRYGEDPADTFRLPSVDLRNPRIGTIELPLPFAPRVLRAWDQRGAVWTGLSSEYRIASIRLSGDTSVVVTREFEPRPLAAAQRDSVDAYTRNLEAQFPVTVPPQARPSHVAPLRLFLVDDEEHLWVCATGLDPCTELDVFGPDSRWLGTVSLPVAILDTPRPLIRDGTIYAVVEGELGEPQLFKGQIIRP